MHPRPTHTRTQPPSGATRATADFQAYADSKLMLLMWGRELQRRLAGSGIDVFTVHPGA